MDMSVKMNLSYPAVRPAEQAGDKPAGRLAETPRDGDTPGLSMADEASKVKDAVSDIEKYLDSTRRNLKFSTDEESGKIVVKVIASETGELIRQLPSEEALRSANNLSDVNSILFDAKV